MSPAQLSYPEALHGLTLKLLDGSTPGELGLSGWQIIDESLFLGFGQTCFLDASDRLMSWQAHAHARVRVETHGEETALYFGPTKSKVRVLSRLREDNRTCVVYGTLPEHVEKGEEAFEITMDAQGIVMGRVVAFSRPAWIWAKIGSPVARLVQRMITQRYLKGMVPASRRTR